MRQRTEIEMEAFLLLTVTRAAIRMKHKLAAERELNTVLPAVEAAFNRAVHEGALPDAITAPASPRKLTGMARLLVMWLPSLAFLSGP